MDHDFVDAPFVSVRLVLPHGARKLIQSLRQTVRPVFVSLQQFNSFVLIHTWSYLERGFFRPVRSLLPTSRTTRGWSCPRCCSMNAAARFGSRFASVRNAQDIAFTIMSS